MQIHGFFVVWGFGGCSPWISHCDHDRVMVTVMVMWSCGHVVTMTTPSPWCHGHHVMVVTMTPPWSAVAWPHLTFYSFTQRIAVPVARRMRRIIPYTAHGGPRERGLNGNPLKPHCEQGGVSTTPGWKVRKTGRWLGGPPPTHDGTAQGKCPIQRPRRKRPSRRRGNTGTTMQFSKSD